MIGDSIERLQKALLCESSTFAFGEVTYLENRNDSIETS